MAANLPPRITSNGNLDQLLDDAYTNAGPFPNDDSRCAAAALRAGLALEHYKANPTAFSIEDLGKQQSFMIMQGLQAGAPQGIPPNAPGWAVAMFNTLNRIDNRLNGIDNRLNGIDNRLNGIDNRLNGIDNRLNGIDNRLNGVENRLDNTEARRQNSFASDDGDMIIPLCDAAGNVPQNFPADYRQLLRLRNNQACVQMLAFYGLDANPLRTRNKRLRRHLGCSH